MVFLWIASCAMAFADEAELKTLVETRTHMLGRPSQVQFAPGGETLFFLRATPEDEGLRLFEFGLKTQKARELWRAEEIVGGAKEELSVEEKAQRERSRVVAQGIAQFELSADGTQLLLPLSGGLYVAKLPSAELVALGPEGGTALNAQFSPDGKHVAYVRGFELHVINLKTLKHRRLTRGGSEELSHGLAEFVAQEEFDRTRGFWFSADSKRLLFQQTNHRGMERLAVVNAAAPESKATSFFYPRAGRPNAQLRLGLVAVSGGPVTWVEADLETHPYLINVRWTNAGHIVLWLMNRPQTQLVLLEIDGKTGKRRRVLLEETDEAWLNVDQNFPVWLSDDSGFFWRTERNGAPEIELRAADGRHLQTWLKPEAGFATWAGFDEKRRTLFFSGGPNPTEPKLYAVKEAGAPELFYGKPGEMAWGWWEESAQRMWALTVSLEKMPRQWVLNADGKVLAEVPSVAKAPGLKPNIEIRQLKGGGPWARVVKPHPFDTQKRYPVVLHIYGGPGFQEVTRSLPAALGLQWLANQGFMVVSFDVRGTPGRGRTWERAIKQNFAELIAQEQVEALKQLAEEFKQMDMSRVGVMGSSFGGYMAAVLTLGHPELFRAGLAMSPVADWRDYDSAYTERYLGTPEAHPETYEKNSVLRYVDQARRPLLLVHGTADDNVYFFHTLKLADALLRKGKACEVLPIANATHMLGADTEIGQRLWELKATFFQKHLQQAPNTAAP